MFRPDELLTPAEIVRLLRLYQSEGPGRNNRRVSVVAIAALAGVSRMLIHRIRAGKVPVTARTQAALSPVLRDIEAGRIRYQRTGKLNTYHYGWTDDRIEYRQPPARPPPPQPRVIAAADYNEWARCQSCGCPRFSRFTGLGGKPHYACDGCVGQADRCMLGAKVAHPTR